MNISELTIGLSVDLSGLREGLAAAETRLADFASAVKGQTQAAGDLTRLGEDIPLTLARGIGSGMPALEGALAEIGAAGTKPLVEWERTGQAAADAMGGHFEDALTRLVAGSRSFGQFWQAMWDDLLRVSVDVLVKMVTQSDSALESIAGRALGVFSSLGGAWSFGLNAILGGLFGGGGLPKKARFEYTGGRGLYTDLSLREPSAPVLPSSTLASTDWQYAGAPAAIHIDTVEIRAQTFGPGAESEEAAESLADALERVMNRRDRRFGLATVIP